MSQFFRLLDEANKENALRDVCNHTRTGRADHRTYEVSPDDFDVVPGKPFSYWVSHNIRNMFSQFSKLETADRTARQGLATAEDFRFLRAWWESKGEKWFGFAKGGSYSPFYSSIDLVVNWAEDGAEIKAGICKRYPYLNGNAEFVAKNPQYYLREGLAYPPTALGYGRKGLGMYALPKNCIFGHKACSIFLPDGKHAELLALLALLSSKAVDSLFRVLAQSRSWEVGHLQKIPIPEISFQQLEILAKLAKNAWRLNRRASLSIENSHTFLAPEILLGRISTNAPVFIETELASIQSKIDDIAFNLYGFTGEDRNCDINIPTISILNSNEYGVEITEDAEDSDSIESEIPQVDALLSWAIGVAYGRFDLHIATGERELPQDTEPFDSLPAKSPAMLRDGDTPFHDQAGLLVDDLGNKNDLPRIVENILERVHAPVTIDVRSWLRKEFFAFHLYLYTKSRRKVPIYWPLSTLSGTFTLWVYYPSLTNQTLFIAVNDFLDGPKGKLTQVTRECVELRVMGSGRSRDDEKKYEALQNFEQELTDLRDTLLKIAPTYQPNHDDGVQITAAPLWPLFRHKPWQKVLKDTWSKLEKGDYDWAHLAMAHWPERVREKCKVDKSLSIAHGLEYLYVEPEAAPKKTRAKKKVWGGE